MSSLTSEAAALFYEDARRTVEAQVAALRESDKNALEIVRATGVVLGLAVSLVALTEPSKSATPIAGLAVLSVAVGLVLLIAAAALGVAVAFKRSVRLGVSPDVIERELATGCEWERAVVGMAGALARAARENAFTLTKTGARLRQAYACFAVGLVMLGAGSAAFLIGGQLVIA